MAGLENNAVFVDFKTGLDQDGNYKCSVFMSKEGQLKEIRFSPKKASKNIKLYAPQSKA